MFTFHYGMPLPKFHLDIPQRSMDVFRRMRNANLSPEFRAYSNSILRMVGSRAVKYAGDYIKAIRHPDKLKPSPITLRLREVVGDNSKAALYQTGQLLNGLFAEVSGSGLEFGVRGPRAGVARIQENGFVVRVSRKMINGFVAIGRQHRVEEIVKWAKSKEVAAGVGLGENTGGSDVIKIPARPFLGPALNRAAQEVLQSSTLVGLDAALVEVISKKIIGGVTDFDSLNKFGAAYSVRPVK